MKKIDATFPTLVIDQLEAELAAARARIKRLEQLTPIPFWSLSTDQDGSFRVSDPTDIWAINFGDRGNLNLVEPHILGRFFKDFAWNYTTRTLRDIFRTPDS